MLKAGDLVQRKNGYRNLLSWERNCEVAKRSVDDYFVVRAASQVSILLLGMYGAYDSSRFQKVNTKPKRSRKSILEDL